MIKHSPFSVRILSLLFGHALQEEGMNFSCVQEKTNPSLHDQPCTSFSGQLILRRPVLLDCQKKSQIKKEIPTILVSAAHGSFSQSAASLFEIDIALLPAVELSFSSDCSSSDSCPSGFST